MCFLLSLLSNLRKAGLNPVSVMKKSIVLVMACMAPGKGSVNS